MAEIGLKRSVMMAQSLRQTHTTRVLKCIVAAIEVRARPSCPVLFTGSVLIGGDAGKIRTDLAVFGPVPPRMNLIALGINHNSAQVEVRERVAFAPEQVSEAMNDACNAVGVDEVVVLSTCNRTEIYAVPSAGQALEEKARALIDWMAGYHHLSADDLRSAAYHHEGEAALRHIVQVAAGLDSMVLGEPQIFGQLKSAFAVARDAGTVGNELGRLFPRAFSIAKKVRTDTAIGENPVSVAFAAVDVARRIFTDLTDCNALLVGAGETIELVTRHLIEAGVSNIVIANRTLGRARELAQKFGAEAVLLSEIPENLPAADIVITSTSSQLPILGKGTVESALKLRRHRPVLMVDIAVPRDIEPQVADLRDVYLYSVDDLRQIVDKNLQARKSEVSKADEIINAGISGIGEEQRTLAAVDLVKQYRQAAEQLRQQEMERALAAITRGDDPQQVLAQLARSITNKLIHAPTLGLKKASAEGRHDVLGHAVRLLGLPVDSLEPEQEAAAGAVRRPAAPPTTRDERKEQDTPPPGTTLQ
jgi:glutamyl-tRNA reductase